MLRLVAMLVALVVTACGGFGRSGRRDTGFRRRFPHRRLRRSGGSFEEANPGTDVVLNLGSSSTLREQILEGAPADVFASANTSNVDQVVEAGETPMTRRSSTEPSPDRGARRQSRRRHWSSGLRKRGPRGSACAPRKFRAASSDVRRWPTPESRCRSTRTNQTCGHCSPKSKPERSMPESST